MTHRSNERAGSPLLAAAAILAALAILTLGATAAQAYNRYNDGCQACHFHFDNTDPYVPPGGGAAWPDDLHRVHRHNIRMSTACDLCHTTGDGNNPYIGSSDGTTNNIGYGCAGCHGRDYGGTTGVSGVGLRAHHAGAGVGGCAACHAGDPSPLPENIAPPYYGTVDTDVNYPCNDDAGTSEDWSGDAIGLDNDGDGTYDLSDANCTSTGICGDGNVDPGETCDPCPSSCDDANACTNDSMTGTPANCDVLCTNTAIATCTDSDGCCPALCDSLNDNDCAPVCGNGVIEASETCDPPAACPTACDDGNSCTNDVLTGSAANCDAVCDNAPIVACTNADGCCPAACDATTDDDCSTTCGNGTIDAGETCDPPASCPTTCDDSDSCTTDTLTGASANCNVSCSNVAVVACTDSDGCCPAGCVNASDNDCTATCGNGTIDAGETCDPTSTCPTSCGDANACTTDVLNGSAATCDAACDYPSISTCTDGDGCCPSGCDVTTDSDCGGGICGNGVIDPGETCDPPGSCPTHCDNMPTCTTGTLSGNAATCQSTCTSVPITTCTDGDFCCPDGCSSSTDTDCLAGTGDDSGCGCGATSHSTPADLAWLSLLLLLALLRRRRHG